MFSGFYLFLVVLLVLFGLLTRFGCREMKRPWLVAAVSILAAVCLWVASRNVAAHGSEGTMILSAMVGCFAAGALLGEIIFLLGRVFRKKV